MDYFSELFTALDNWTKQETWDTPKEDIAKLGAIFIRACRDVLTAKQIDQTDFTWQTILKELNQFSNKLVLN